MTYYTYMVRKYSQLKCPEGDLARDMKFDKKHFPKNRSTKIKAWHDIILNYLYDEDACSDCIEIFERTWEEYTEWMKNR